MERLFYFFPVFEGFTHLLLGLLHATETTAAYSNSYTELSEIYGKYKDVIINDPSLKALHIKYIVYIKWARFRLQVFESLQGLRMKKRLEENLAECASLP